MRTAPVRPLVLDLEVQHLAVGWRRARAAESFRAIPACRMLLRQQLGDDELGVRQLPVGHRPAR